MPRRIIRISRAYAAGERSGDRLTATGRESLEAHPEVRVDYFAVVDPVDMRPVDRASTDSVAIVAARVGPTRLIDNMILNKVKKKDVAAPQ